MPTRIRTGIIVHATSIMVLWVVFDGTGLARALNLTTTVTSSASTNSVITVMIDQKPIVHPHDAVHHRRRRRLQIQLPRAAARHFFGKSRATGQQRNAPPTPIPETGGPIWPFDIFMPLALP